MDPTLAIILKDTYSTTQLKHRLRILKAELVNKFFGGGPEDGYNPGLGNAALKGNKPGLNIGSLSPQDQNWLKSLPADFYKKFNKSNVYKIFSDLESKISNIPTLTLYLTFEPDESTLEQIGNFARKMFGPNLMLDIKLDLTLIAGAALGWKGVLRDYSIKTQIEAKKGEILESFKRFLRTKAAENP